MARRPRIFISGVSVHAIHRGNNRMAIFCEPADYASFLGLLVESIGNRHVSVHAYSLMTTHVHLIMTPDTHWGVPRAMQEASGRYARYFNDKYGRIGTMWNGRYRALPIGDERYWLTCLRYVEQNPVRAGIAARPDDFRWSSYHAHAFGKWPDWLIPHPVYLALGKTPEERQRAYRALCAVQLLPDEVTLLRRGQSGV